MFKRGLKFISENFSLNTILYVKLKQDDLSLAYSGTCVLSNKVISSHLCDCNILPSLLYFTVTRKT